MAEAPTGTVTLLFTDIEGSTQMLHRLGDRYAQVLSEHRRLLRAAFAAHGGYEVDTQGDAFLIAFADATEAVAAGVAAQQALAAHPWPDAEGVRVRMGLHTGTPIRTDEGYAGVDLHRGARVAAAGHGGQILITQATADLVRGTLPPEVSLRDLGYHRLKDFPEPAILFQIVLPHLQNEFPPIRSLRTGSNNLPAQTTSFVGREQEIDEVNRLLDSTRLLTVLGPGGIGKTRLALEAAAARIERYKDGVWFVELAPLADPALVPGAVAQAAGVREEPGKPIATVLVEALQSRNLLLVLDNCEHVVGACATLAQSLLAACPGVQVLASSQEILRTAGESVYRLSSLTLPGDGHLPPLEQLRAFEAVRLFAERANAVLPGFEVTDQNDRAVVDICRHLDGIPLALELAAARVRVLSPAQIAERLADRFRLLGGGSRTAQPRQQTLRGAIDWSYSLLNEGEKVVLRRLSVFAGGWSIEAAETVCADDGSSSPSLLPQGAEVVQIDVFEVLDFIAELVDKSLITRRGDETESRFGMLESIRQYAGEKLATGDDAVRFRAAGAVHGFAAEKLAESDEATAIRTRHLNWYLSFAEHAEPELDGPDQAAWLGRLETEHDNLRAALDWGLVSADETPGGLRLAAALWRFWHVHGHVADGRQAMERALAATPRAPTNLRASALSHANVLAREEGELERAAGLGSAAVELYRELGDARGLSLALTNLGSVERALGHHERATALVEESLELQRGAGDQHAFAISLGNVGLAARDGGDYARAVELYSEALQLFREQKDASRVAWILTNLAGVMIELHEYDRANALCAEAFPLAEALQDKRRLAWLRRVQGMVARGQGDNDLAWERLLDSLARFEEIGDQQGIAHCLRELAATATACDRPADAVPLLEAETRMREAAGIALTPDLGARRDRYLAEARSALGEEAFASAWEESRSVALDATIAAALRGAQPA